MFHLEFHNTLPILIKPDGSDDKNIRFSFGSNTEVYQSCSVTWQGQMYVFGGKRSTTQVSNVTVYIYDLIVIPVRLARLTSVHSKKLVLCPFNINSAGAPPLVISLSPYVSMIREHKIVVLQTISKNGGKSFFISAFSPTFTISVASSNQPIRMSAPESPARMNILWLLAAIIMRMPSCIKRALKCGNPLMIIPAPLRFTMRPLSAIATRTLFLAGTKVAMARWKTLSSSIGDRG